MPPSTAIAASQMTRRRASTVISQGISTISRSTVCKTTPVSTTPESFRPRADEPHHLCPFVGFGRDQRGEIGWRPLQHHDAKIVEARLQFGVGKAGVDLAVEQINDLH